MIKKISLSLAIILGINSFYALPTFAQSYDSCAIGVSRELMFTDFEDLPAEYQGLADEYSRKKVDKTEAGTGNCNYISYTCNVGDILVECNPCAMEFYKIKLKDKYKDKLIKDKCGHLQDNTETATNTDSDFDFAAQGTGDNAAIPYLKTEEEPKPIETKTSGVDVKKTQPAKQTKKENNEKFKTSDAYKEATAALEKLKQALIAKLEQLASSK